MFGLRYYPGHPGPSQASVGVITVVGRWVSPRAILKLGLMVIPLSTGLSGGASAQALGTMQVTARVLPGAPAWAGLAEAQALGRQVLLSPVPGSHLRRADLVQARAELAMTGRERRLLVRVDYPRN